MDEFASSFAAVAGMTVATFGSLYYLNKYGKKNLILCGKVSKLMIYPLKSCRGIEVDEITITQEGMQYGPVQDREWMIITDDGNMVSHRALENIALLRQALEGDKLILSAPGMEPLKLQTNPKVEKARVREVSLFGHPVSALDCGDEAGRWICEFLGRDNLRIVHLPTKMDSIKLSQFNQKDHFYARDGDVKRLHDAAPFMLMSQASINDVNSKIADVDIDVHRFRPNILVDGCEAHDEDNWKQVVIGENNGFTRIAMCSRCIATTVNPEKPNKAKDSLEPLKTLRTYRLAPPHNGYGRSPIIGVYCTPDVLGGTIRVGDPVLAIKEHY